MAYFAPYIDETGIHLPTYAERMEDLVASYRSIFGDVAELTPAVPDYQLLSIFARALDDTSALVVAAYNARNPAYAQGTALDLLLPQYGISRIAATCSEATLNLTGTAGTVIPAGASVGDTAGRIWKTVSEVTLSSGGTGTVTVRCETSGQIYAAANTINQILSSTPGWSGATNPAGSGVGMNEETDAEVRARIAPALASKGVVSVDSIRAALLELPYVQMAAVRVNESDTTDGNGIPGHSIAVVVNGGIAGDVALTIYKKKAPGIGTYGTTSTQITDEQGNTHTINFSRVTSIQTYAQFTLKRLAGFDQTAVEAAIKAAAVTHISGLGIGVGLNVPQLVGIAYGAVPESLRSTFVISNVQGNSSSTGVVYDVLPCAWNQRLMSSASRITFYYPA